MLCSRTVVISLVATALLGVGSCARTDANAGGAAVRFRAGAADHDRRIEMDAPAMAIGHREMEGRKGRLDGCQNQAKAQDISPAARAGNFSTIA